MSTETTALRDVTAAWRRKSTPWGCAQDAAEVAPGVVRISTAGHGGYWLDGEHQAELKRRFPGFSTYAGGPWYEEDQDWAVVCLCWPELFPSEALRHARQTVRASVSLESDREFTSRIRGWVPRGWASVLEVLEAETARKTGMEIAWPGDDQQAAGVYEVRQ